jgi:hypothetical protein
LAGPNRALMGIMRDGAGAKPDGRHLLANISELGTSPNHFADQIAGLCPASLWDRATIGSAGRSSERLPAGEAGSAFHYLLDTQSAVYPDLTRRLA